MEILSSACHCPKMESTCSKICFGATQHRMGSAALTSSACPAPTRPCWTHPLQCRRMLLRQETAAPSCLCTAQPFWGILQCQCPVAVAGKGNPSQCSGVMMFGLLHRNPPSKPVTYTHKLRVQSWSNNLVCALIQFLTFCSASCLHQDSSNKRQLK